MFDSALITLLVKPKLMHRSQEVLLSSSKNQE